MENRKYLIFIVFIISLLCPVLAYGYGYETHGYLVKETVDFYLLRGGLIPGYLTPYLIDGARREDDAPRPMNHFFDPVYNRGFSYDARIDPLLYVGNYPSSKQWAQSSAEQNKPFYKAASIIASILSSFQQRRLNLTTESDFTWNIALDYWAKGDKEKAMFALGHVLHLIQDASVPDHTRNDAHHEGSPYENWTSKFVLSNSDSGLKQRLQTKNLVVFSDLNSFFDSITKYSNNNFYSKDTIGIKKGYKLPEPYEYETIIDILYSLNKDSDGQFKILAQPITASVLSGAPSTYTIDNPLVLSDYWSRLSTKSVEHGAGIIDLFLKEANKREADYLSRLPWYERALQWVNNQANSLLGMAGQSDLSFGNESSLMPSPLITTPTPTIVYQYEFYPLLSPSPLSSPRPRVFGAQDIGTGNNGPLFSSTRSTPTPDLFPLSEPTETPTPELSPTPEPTLTPTPEPTPELTPTPEPTPTPVPSPTPLPIPKLLDLRWGVDPSSITGYSLEFLYQDIGFVDVYTQLYTNRYHLYFYLNRFQEYSYGFNHNLWQEMFLAEAHTSDLVRFYYPICDVDGSLRNSFHVRVAGDYDYCAGEYWNHRWVYRANELPHVIDPSAGIWVIKLPIASLPKPFIELTPSDYITASLYTADYYWGYWTSNFAQMDDRQWYFENVWRDIMITPTPTPTSTPEPTPEPTPANTVVINEIAWMGTGASAYDEWIELYNGAGDEIDLTNWRLRSISGEPDIILSGSIESGGYYLLERTDDTTVSDISADLIYTGALNNDCEVLELVDDIGNVVDTVGCNGSLWYSGDNETKSSMERINWTEPGDSPSNWQTNNGVVINGLDAETNPIQGTPKSLNSAAIR